MCTISTAVVTDGEYVIEEGKRSYAVCIHKVGFNVYHLAEWI